MSTSDHQPAGPRGASFWGSVGRDGCAVLPSMLLCDFANLEREVRQLEEAGCRALHLDVMDGHFVPNLTYGLPLVRAFRRVTELPLDVHLMIDRPERYVEAFHEAGADSMTIHVEATADPAAVLRQIRAVGAAAGLALNPPTPLDRIEPLLEWCDVVLVMSVMPGFGGQAFDASALAKLRTLAELPSGPWRLEVDGGISEQTIGAAAGAGAEVLVVGSAIFRTQDYAAAYRRLETLAGQGYRPGIDG